MLLCVCSTDLFDAFRSHSQMRRGVGPCHTNNTTSQAPSPPTAAQQSTEPSYAACGKTCASNGPPKDHSGASECAPSVSLPCRSYRLPLGDPSRHGAETSHPPPVRTPARPARPIVPRLGLVCRASLHMAVHAATHPPDAGPVCLSLLCWRVFLAMFVPSTRDQPAGIPLPPPYLVSCPLAFPLSSLPSEARCCRRDLAFSRAHSLACSGFQTCRTWVPTGALDP